jgi:hypothetical protein
MSDAKNLEPIEDSDLNLKEKFIGGSESGEKIPENKIQSIEGNVERKEGDVEREASYSKILSKIPARAQTQSSNESVSDDAEMANAGINAESKITNLVNLAETKGIPHAVKVARHMEDNYTLDEFHDRLLGEDLHNALVKRGMIKEI